MIYQRIREICKIKGISIRELEHQLGYSNGTIRKWHDSAPSKKLNQICQYLNLNIDWVISGYVAEDDLKSMFIFNQIKKLPPNEKDLLIRLIKRLGGQSHE